MNKNISLINKYNSNIDTLNNQIAELQQAIKVQEVNILEAKKNLFVEEINGKTFKLRKTSRSKFYDLEFNVNIDIDTYDFSGSVKVLNPEFKKNWKWNLLDIAEDTDCYIVVKFYEVTKTGDETYTSKNDTIGDYKYSVEEMVDAYLEKKLVIID